MKIIPVIDYPDPNKSLELQGFIETCREDRDIVPIFRDWLEERGWEEWLWILLCCCFEGESVGICGTSSAVKGVGYKCTLYPGHEGPHVACSFNPLGEENRFAVDLGRHFVHVWKVEMECSYCNEMSLTVRRRRLNTAYEHEPSNFVTSCLNCYSSAVEYYQERWDEYYGGRL